MLIFNKLYVKYNNLIQNEQSDKDHKTCCLLTVSNTVLRQKNNSTRRNV